MPVDLCAQPPATIAVTSTGNTSLRIYAGFTPRPLTLRRQRDKPADDRAVCDMGHECDERGHPAVVQQEESGRLEQRRRVGGGQRGGHAGMDHGQQDVDERRSGKHPVHEPEDRPQPPTALADDAEDRVVAEREGDAEDEVETVAECLRPPTVPSEGRSEQEGDVHPRQAKLARRSQDGREDERADKAAREGSPDAHGRSSLREIASAAPMSDRWVSAWGKLPRKSPLEGSISSE